MEEQVKTLEKKLEERNQNMQILMQMVRDIKESQSQDSPRKLTNGANSTRPQVMIPKLHCPSFDGNNPRLWLKKCSRYFNLCNMANESKVELASLYMVDRAEKWVTNYLAVRRDMMVEWDDFIVD